MQEIKTKKVVKKFLDSKITVLTSPYTTVSISKAKIIPSKAPNATQSIAPPGKSINILLNIFSLFNLAASSSSRNLEIAFSIGENI
jgi:hypothetical protein